MNILIIDDHILFAEGMKYLLESMQQDANIYFASDADSTLQHIVKNGNPDLILLDVNLPGINGYALLKKLQQLNVWSPVLMISATESPAAMGKALSRGASGFISKSSNSDVLLKAIKTVMGGDIYMPYQEPRDNTHTQPPIMVTTRQQEVLYLLSQGLLNKQIAHELNISANTVKAHLHEIFRILKANNRTAAVQSAYKEGLL